MSSELGCVSYPEHLGVVQSGHQHQALGGEDLSWLDDSRLLIHLIHLAGFGLLQLNTEKKRYNYSHIRVAPTTMKTLNRWHLSHLWVVQALPEGKAGTGVTLWVDVSQNRYKEGGRLSLRNQLPTAGLTELEKRWKKWRRWKVKGNLGDMGWWERREWKENNRKVSVHTNLGDISEK